MGLSGFSVRRPVAMSCLIIGLTLLGLNSYRKLGLELLPKLDMPIISVVTVYPGASPEEIETDVAGPIEDAVTAIDGLKHATSVCMEDVCQTIIEFDLDVDVDIAAMDVREKLDLIRAKLPAAAEDPKVQKFNINATPVLTMALTGDAPLDQIYDFADNELRDKLSVIPGVADIQLIGGAPLEAQILLDREKLAARGLTSLAVMQAVQQAVGTVPSGRLRENGTEYAVKFAGDPEGLQGLAEIEIANQAGQRCRIREVGRVVMASAELRQLTRLDGRQAVAIRVVKKADANAVRVVGLIRAAVETLRPQLPGGMDLVWVTDDGAFIEATNLSAWTNVIQGILLTAAILFLFLYNFQSLLVVSITMPLTVVIGLFFMQLAGFTLNTSTLISIGMSVGILVTNSIVVLEAIVKRLQAGAAPAEAAVLGSRESFIAVLASAGTNVVVLFPLASMHSKIGLFIRPLALTMFIMTVVSLFISFTLTPMLCALLLRRQDAARRGPVAWFERKWNRGFDRLVGGYRGCLVYLQSRRWAAALVLLAVLGMFVHSLGLAGKLGSSMVNEPDKGEIYVKVEYPTSFSLTNTVARVAGLERRLAGLPELRHTLVMVGKVEGMMGKSSDGVYLAQLVLKFSERTERRLTIYSLLEDVRARLRNEPGCIIAIQQPSAVGGQESPVLLEISGPRLEELNRLAADIQGLAADIPKVVDTDTSVRAGKPELRLRPKRPALAELGLPAAAVGASLRGNLAGLEAGVFKRNARNYDIVVKLEEREGRAQVADFAFSGTAGRPLLLENLASVEERLAPTQITRKNKRRLALMYANLDHGLPLGTAVKLIGDKIRARGLPPGYEYNFAGLYEVMSEGHAGFAEAMLLSVLLVVLSLAAIMESFRQPLLILITLPLALIGTIWALALTGESLGVFVIMSIVMMIGIVVNNAILVMDQFNMHRAEGYSPHTAMISASCESFRPVAMITIAAVIGMLPLALGQGIGAEMRTGVGIASVGGILVSGILTLVVLPVVYDFITPREKL